jgi:hypothetical protein
MSDWGIALIAAGSAILGSAVTGFFAWKAGHRQAAAAEAAGQAQAAALISTVQATLDEQRRARAAEQRRLAYANLLTVGFEYQVDPTSENGTRLLTAFGLVELEGPVDVMLAAKEYVTTANGQAANLDAVLASRDRYLGAARRALSAA